MRSRATANPGRVGRTVFKVVVALFAVYNLATGLWGFLDPQAFFLNIVLFAPFNQHLVRDASAFFTGLWAAVLVAFLCSDALLTALVGASVASVLHFVSHVLDRSLGGRPIDPEFTGAVAVVVVALTVIRFWIVRADAAGHPMRRGQR
jgi:quinol-cytochrome oxidoreductase complex cytochrome b subunit